MMQITDQFLQAVKSAPKYIIGPQPHEIRKKSRHWNFEVQFDNSVTLHTKSISEFSLGIYVRKNELDEENFSCGIFMTLESGGRITLSRYNGSNHEHGPINCECHIHHATAESINRGDRKPEAADTQVTDRYTELYGALKCLSADYKINVKSGSQPTLFDEPTVFDGKVLL